MNQADNNNVSNKLISICSLSIDCISQILCFLPLNLEPTVNDSATYFTINKLFNQATKLKSSYNNPLSGGFLYISRIMLKESLHNLINVFICNDCYHPYLNGLNISTCCVVDLVEKINNQGIVDNHNNNKIDHYKLFDRIINKYKQIKKNKSNINAYFIAAVDQLSITKLWYTPIILFPYLTSLSFKIELYNDGLIELIGKYLSAQLIKFSISYEGNLNSVIDIKFNQLLLLQSLSAMHKLQEIVLCYELLAGYNCFDYLSKTNLTFTVNKLRLEFTEKSTNATDDLLFINKFNKISELTLRLTSLINEQLFNKLLFSLKDQLIILDISHSINITDKHLTNIGELKLLKQLNISCCAHLTEQALVYVNNCINLECLTCNEIDVDGKSINNLFNLTLLNIQNTSFHENIINQGYWNNLINLKILDISKAEINELALANLGNICGKTLQQLRFGHKYCDVTFECINKFINLQELTIWVIEKDNTSFINDDNLTQLIDNWPPNLHLLSVGGFTTCTDKVLVYLYNNIKNNHIKNLCSLSINIGGECTINSFKNLLHNNKLVHFSIGANEKYVGKNLKKELITYYNNVVNRDIRLPHCYIYA